MTTFVNTSVGDEIWAPKKIAKHYVFQGSFLADLLSTAPLLVEFGVITSDSPANNYIQVLGMLKLGRLSRIGKVIANLNMTTEFKAFLRTIYIVFGLVIFIHVVACFLWYQFTNSDKEAYPLEGPSWVPPLEFIFVTTTLFDETTPFID
mmetsp:Transcript_81200/g.112454  ORF Transcript_81200/g.112454 Transcript_81200/m.112454 type:complete len:149 (+) Transcript_81200:231-677(+)